MHRLGRAEFYGRRREQPVPSECVSSEVKTVQFYDNFTETSTALEIADVFLHHHLCAATTASKWLKSNLAKAASNPRGSIETLV